MRHFPGERWYVPRLVSHSVHGPHVVTFRERGTPNERYRTFRVSSLSCAMFPGGDGTPNPAKDA